jgi:D-lactate dehydrogenase
MAEHADCDVISVFIYSRITEQTLEAFPRLRLVATRSTGYDHIDLQACQKRGVAVCHVPNYGENTVAEHTFALILALSRKLHKAAQRTRALDFSLKGLEGFDLYGKTLGVVGAGSIGLHVIRIGRAMGMRVLAYDVVQNRLLAEVLDFSYADLDTLLRESDVVTLHAPLTPATRHMFDGDTIAKMKKGALLINTARGELVETPAVIRALDEGRLGGAGLDVLEGEAAVKEERQLLLGETPPETLKAALQDYALARREDVIVTPHMAFYSREALGRILDTTVDNILSFLEGNPKNLAT